ncbi:MAG TPA: DUF6335 family protein, partial [Vicinamibacterales bacterium]|nr:DUF6335 family protein [Vicinamibacterales bacterium]
MATRKAGRASKKKGAARRRAGGGARKAAKKRASAKKRAAPRARKPVRRAKVRTASRKAAKRVAKRRVRRPKVVARRRVAAPKSRRRVVKKTTQIAPARSSAAPPARRAAPPKRVVRTAPGLDRERRRISDDEFVPTPPSSLDMDRSASAARSGRRELREKYDEHTETGPAMTGGDIDADWESAYSVGDEAPGGDNPTPDQDIVDDIGKAVGVQYNDNEELKGEKKITERDRHRWELDPASSD